MFLVDEIRTVSPWPDAPGSIESRLAASFSLTPAEARVAAFLSRGTADASIAEALGVRVSTIRSQSKSILAKAGVRTKAELAHILTCAILATSGDNDIYPLNWG